MAVSNQAGQPRDYKSMVDAYVDEENVDQNEASASGGSIAPPAEGRAYCRIVEYIELGQHLGTYQGKPKTKPDTNVRIVIELSGKKYPPIELEDGTTTPQKLFLSLNQSANEKSRFYKLFRVLNGMYGDKYKHFAQMAADNVSFIAVISHRSSGEGKDAKVYPNIWKDGAWQLQSLVKYDADGEPDGFLTVAPATTPTTIFLFNRPDLRDWAQIFIDGQRDDGTSKNWIQEHIMEAVNFEGSPLQALLMDLPDAGTEQKKAPTKTNKKPAKADSLADDI